MIRVLNVAERGIYPITFLPVVLAAATKAVIIPDQVVEPRAVEIAYRYIQNAGANPMYYGIGFDCDSTNFSGIIDVGQQLDVSSHRLLISGWSTLGTTACVTILARADFTIDTAHSNPIAR